MEETFFEWLERTGLVDTVLLAAAIGAPLVLAVVAAVLRDRPVVMRRRADWVMATIAAPIVYLLWRAFNAIMDHFGVETLFASVLCLGLFASVALGTAGLWRVLAKKLQ